MAALTTNISNVSLTISGTTQKSATISWTCPSVPSDVTITSCTLTGTATASMRKGSATITVNGTTVSSGSNFTINLGTGNTTSSVTATAKGGNKNASGTVTLSNLIYTVNYAEPVTTYTVKFVDWDGTVLKTQAVESGSSATAPSNPTRTGYIFTGWDKSYANITSDLTITAQYEKIIYHTVTFIDYDGSVLKTQTVENGGSATAPDSPSRYGYKFIGWDKSFNNITSDLTVTAQYEKLYTVTFVDYDGTVLKIEEVISGNSATAPIISRYGYELIGWSVDFSSVTSDITTIAQYVKLNVFKVKENGSWTNIKKICKKIDGVWVEQQNDDWEETFSLSAGYIKNQPNPIAISYSDGTLIFQDSDVIDTSHGDVVATYTGWDTESYYNTIIPWVDEKANLNNIYINTIVSPDYGNYFFSDCTSLTSLDLSNFDTSNSKNMKYMFTNCPRLTFLDISNFDTSNVIDMKYMFYGCVELPSLDVSNFDTRNVTNMSCMFYDCEALSNLDINDWNTNNVTDMSYMFNKCYNLNGLDVSNWNTSNVTNMTCMFQNCSVLNNLDVSGWNTDKVTDMSYMFNKCYKLDNLDVSNWNTNNVTKMIYMFSDCNSLQTLDLSNFNTDKVTNMYALFSKCSSLSSLDLRSFNTNNVTDMNFMFNACTNLTSVDLSSFNTSNVTNMGALFQSCPSLISVDLRSFDTSKVTNMGYMFFGCSSLTSVDLSSFDIGDATTTTNMFYGCTNPNLIIYVKDEATKTKIESSSSFPATATVVVGSSN